MKALIVCGGKGTRVQSINKEIPKALFPVSGKPIIQHQIEWLKKYGIDEIIFCTGYLGNQIKEFVNKSELGIEAVFSEETEPLGTGGAIKNAEYFAIGNDILVVFGDLMIEMDLGKLLKFHKSHDGMATIVVHKTDHPWDSELIKLDNNGKIIEIIKRPGKMKTYPSEISKTSVYVLEKEVFGMIPNGKVDFEKGILPQIAEEGKAYGYYTDEFVRDMGTPERYDEVQKKYNL